MPDVEPLRFPSREGRPGQQDEADLQADCSGRRRTYPLLNSPLPCVNNAIHHIQELKMKVENWCEQVNVGLSEDSQQCLTLNRSDSLLGKDDQSGKYPSTINQDQYSKNFRYQYTDSDNESGTSGELFVEGIAISSQDSCPIPPLLKKINDVLGEVVCLIERLEADRQYAVETLQKEKRRKRFLENQMDSISIWKQQQHTILVQKEQEAGLRKTTELTWKLKLEREKLEQAQEKLSFIEVWNRTLHEDVDFAKKQIPIVKENLELQRGIINQFNTKQAETDEATRNAHNKVQLVDNEKKKMELDIINDMRVLNQAVLVIKNQLKSKSTDLNQLKILEEGIWLEITKAEQEITLMEKKTEATKQRISEMMESEKTENDWNLQSMLQIKDETRRNKTLKEKLIALQENINKTRLHGEAEVSCIEEQLLSKHNALAALRKENLKCEQKVENYKKKISESINAVRQMREEREQMLQNIIDNDENWEKAKKEVTHVADQHSVTQTKLKEQEKINFIEEQRVTKEIETMRIHLTGQMTALERVTGQCANKKEELCRQQRSSKQANKKLQKEFEEVSKATKELETKVMKIQKLTEHFEKIQCEHNNTLAHLEKEKKLQYDHLSAARVSHDAVVKKYDNNLFRINDLTKKSEEYRNASAKMEEIVESMPEVIAEIESIFDAMEFKNKSAALVMSTLQSDINNCQQRAQRSMQTHTAHVTARKKKMEDTTLALILALKENQRLASEYEGLQMILVEAKLEAVSALSEKNHAYGSFHYYTQLSLLQKRMHKALVKYLKQRSLYSQAELDRCQALSQETDQNLQTAEEGLSAEIQLIAAFLQSLTDDSTTTDDAGVNKQASPGSNE